MFNAQLVPLFKKGAKSSSIESIKAKAKPSLVELGLGRSLAKDMSAQSLVNQTQSPYSFCDILRALSKSKSLLGESAIPWLDRVNELAFQFCKSDCYFLKGNYTHYNLSGFCFSFLVYMCV